MTEAVAKPRSKARPDGLTPVWKALSDPSRRRILDLLRRQPRTTGELAGRFRTTRFAVMKHLGVLERARLVTVRRRGRERWNHLNAVPLQQIYERWISPYEAEWAASLLRLKRSAELTSHTQGEDVMSTAAKKVTSIQPSAAPALNAIQIEQEVRIEAPPNRVFEALTQNVSAWWGAPYLYNQQATDIVLEPRVGGRMFEVWGQSKEKPEDEGALWAVVTAIERNKQLTLSGPMGMNGAVSGHIAYMLEPAGKNATTLKLSHRVIGEVTEETRQNYSFGWTDLLATRLKQFVESGKRAGLKA
jgi:DNA-binding transcriptional ArsR family regulator/uncharacterized protein YndB with AHSA1/START domain